MPFKLKNMNRLIIISGDLAAGKSTLANRLGEYLSFVVLNKDPLKEIECDVFGYSSREENKLLSVAAMKNMIHVFSRLAKVGTDTILEANFRSEEVCDIADIASEYNYNVVSIILRGNQTVLYQRFLERMETRHKAHISIGLQNDYNRFVEYNQYLRNQDLVFEPFIVDTTTLGEDATFEKVIKFLSQEKFI